MPEGGSEPAVLRGRSTVEMQCGPPAAYATTVRRAVTWPNGPWACPARAASVQVCQRIGRFRSARAGRIPGPRSAHRPAGIPQPQGRWDPPDRGRRDGRWGPHSLRAGEIPGPWPPRRTVGIPQPQGGGNPRTMAAATAGGDSTAPGPVESPDRGRRDGRWGFHSLRAGEIPGPWPPRRPVGTPQPQGR
jgi:hypothetical protein